MTYLNLQLPPLAELIFDQLNNMIEFSDIEPEAIIQNVVDKDFSLLGLISNNMNIFNEDQQVSYVVGISLYIAAGFIVMLLLLLLWTTSKFAPPKYQEMANSKINNFKESFLWNGAVESLKMGYFQNCI